MAAVKTPLMPSPQSSLMSAFSPYTDSPSSPAPYYNNQHASVHPDSSGHLHPHQQSQSSPKAFSPSETDPSPISTSSNDTTTTEIDETAIEERDPGQTSDKEGESQRASQGSSKSSDPGPLKVEITNTETNDTRPLTDEDDTPSSVIHAPASFESWHARKSPPHTIGRSTPTPSQLSDITVISPQIEEDGDDQRFRLPTPISTSVAPARDWTATPRAQTRQEAEADETLAPSWHRSSSLEDIPEAQDADQFVGDEPKQSPSFLDQTIGHIQETTDEVEALRLALSECWTLCNTLAGLSYIHRERIFSSGGKGDIQEQAWKSCWKLCQKLYETRDEYVPTQIRPTLDLCRAFCQALFEVRQREHEVADSVLRVSFEMNNHLYNTHDRALPEAFRERTLDFYITLCHRLMKQRTQLPPETDSLLRACWSLAEMLFSLRQNKRDGRPADEELLGSAVQACWELCDLFREGWTQVRPDRGTPRPSQTTFTQAFQQTAQSERGPATISIASSSSELETDDEFDYGRANPETPTTIFEDTQQLSPEDPIDPHILILGPELNNSNNNNSRFRPQAHNQGKISKPNHWSSASSTLSGFSKSSHDTTSSTSTVQLNSNRSDHNIPIEDPRLTCLKLLLVKAAIMTGFERPAKPTKDTPPGSMKHHQPTLTVFVKSLSSSSFGTQPWQISLLESYKKLIASDPSAFRNLGPARRASGRDVARAVEWMVRNNGGGLDGGRWFWLKDLYRFVFGFRVEEGDRRGGGVIHS